MNTPAMAPAPKASKPVQTGQQISLQKTTQQTPESKSEFSKISSTLKNVVGLSEEQSKSALSSLNEEQLKSVNKVVGSSAAIIENNQSLKEEIKNKFIDYIQDVTNLIKEKALEKFNEQFDKFLDSIKELVEKVKEKINTKEETKKDETTQEQKVTQKDIETLLKETEKLLDKKIPERKEAILNDIRETLRNPDRINQGEFSTCVASAAINSAVKNGKANVLIEVLNEQLEKSNSLVESLKGEYGEKALETKCKNARDKMLGGTLQAALMSYASDGYVFNADGSTCVKTGVSTKKNIQGLTDTQIVKLHERLNSPNESKAFEMVGSLEDLEKLLKANKGGINVKLKWGNEGAHVFHMVNVVGITNDGRVIIKNSQDADIAGRKYDKNGLETMSFKQFSEKLCFGMVENAPDNLKNTIIIDAKEIKHKDRFIEDGGSYVHGIDQKIKEETKTIEQNDLASDLTKNTQTIEEENKKSGDEENTSNSYDPFIKEEKAKEQLDYLKDYKYLIEYYERLNDEKKAKLNSISI